MTTAFAISSVCSKLRNARSAKKTGLGISLSEKEPSSRRIGDSPATLRGGARLPRLRPMVIRKTLKKAARKTRDELHGQKVGYFTKSAMKCERMSAELRIAEVSRGFREKSHATGTVLSTVR